VVFDVKPEDLDDNVLSLIYENYNPSRADNLDENTQVENLITSKVV
jgi:hypothetical protein